MRIVHSHVNNSVNTLLKCVLLTADTVFDSVGVHATEKGEDTVCIQGIMKSSIDQGFTHNFCSGAFCLLNQNKSGGA